MTSCAECFFGGETCKTKGDSNSTFVIVGESPGALELADGIPFVGESGKLLHSILNEFSDLSVEPYFINAFNCMPRQKDPKRLMKAVKACNGRLMEEINAKPRKVILALGNAAAWATTQDYEIKITKARGTLVSSELAEEGIVLSVHPSFILRGGGNISQLKRDIQLAINLHEGISLDDALAEGEEEEMKPVIRAVGQYKEGQNRILTDKKEVAEFCDKLKGLPGEIIGSDFETDGFDPYLDERFIEEPKFFNAGILCGGFSYCDDYNIIIPGHLLTDEIFQNDCKFGWHNGKFDMKWGLENELPSIRIDEDSMMLSYALNEKGGMHDLEQVGGDWLNAPDYKAMLEKYLPNSKTSYKVIPEDVLFKYQGLDSGLTRQLIIAMRPRVNSDARLKRLYEEILIPASSHLCLMERTGFKPDPEQVNANLATLQSVCDELEAEFVQLSRNISQGKNIYGMAKKTPECNIRSWQQIGQFLYRDLGLGREGMPTDAKTLERLDDHPAVLVLRKFRKVNKLLSTYVKPAVERSKATGRVHTTFKLHGTTTGRLSSSQPNIQNIPRNTAVRGQYIASPGRVVLECDLSQAELRMLAQLSGDENLCSIFWNEEQSLHDEVAIGMFGEGFTKDQKVAAKCVNFGIVYGITAPGLADRVSYFTKKHVEISEAQEWINAWSKRFPDAWDFIQACRNAVVKKMTLVSAFGRKRRFNIVTRERLQNLQNEAANFPHQSGASDITLLAGMQLREPIKEEFDANMVNTVHDCLVNTIEDDMEIIIACARKVISVMEDIPKQWGLTKVPFKAEAEVGYRWGNCKEFHPFDEQLLNNLGSNKNDRTIAKVFGLNHELAPGVLEAIESME